MGAHQTLPDAPPAPPAPPTGWRRFAMPSLADAMFALVSVTVLSMGGALSNRDGDLGRHLTLGRQMLETRKFPTVDIYSYTSAGGAMVPHEWVAQVVFAAAHEVWGFDGVALVVLVAVGLAWATTTRLLLARGLRASAVMATVVVGAAASMIHWATRPHVFTFIFIVIWVALLDDLRTGRRTHIWWVVPLTIVWANTHGAFIMGFVLIGTYLVGAMLDRRFGVENHASTGHLLAALGGSLAASIVNPVGIRLITNSFAYIGEDFLLEFTSEYNSPNFHGRAFWPFAALIVASMLLKWRKTPTNILVMVSWTAFGLYSFRNIPIYALVTAPIVAEALDGHLAGLADRYRDRLPTRWTDPTWPTLHRSVVGGAMSVAVLALLTASLVRAPGTAYGFSQERFPLAAMAQIDGEYPGQRVFNQFEWGGYLLDCCWPHVEVFIDGQTDYYGPELTMEYEQVVDGLPGWAEVLSRYEVDWVIVSSERPLAQVLAASPGWTETYRDDEASVFVIAR